MKFSPSVAKGVVKAPPSKSAAHRALILAYLAGDTKVSPLAMSDDILATIDCLRALGATVEIMDDTARVTRGKIPKVAALYVKESGSTLRFFMPLVAVLGVECTFYGEGKLATRPYKELQEELCRHGATFSRDAGLPVTVSGQLTCGEYALAGNISSQYISGLLLALPYLHGNSALTLTTELESSGYVDLTLQMLLMCGVKITHKERERYCISGASHYRAEEITVEGDYSNAAFFLAAGALSGDVTVSGLNPRSKQGDRAIIDILLDMGALTVIFGNRIQVKKSKLQAMEIDVSQIPDLAPILAVLLAGAEGEGRLVNASRLRLKECDRFRGILENLSAAGVAVSADGDDIIIRGGTISGGALQGFRDHRMVMAAAIMGLVAPISVTDAAAVNKSYPNFFECYRALGGKTDG